MVLTAIHEKKMEKDIEKQSKDHTRVVEKYSKSVAQISRSAEHVAKYLSKEVTYEKKEFTYFVGADPENDRWIWHYKLCPEEEIMVNPGIQFGVRGENVRTIQEWKDLRINVNGVKRELSSEWTIHDIPRYHEDREQYWRADLYFIPPIKPNETVEFEITGKWPGTWDDLRETKFDQGYLTIQEPTKKVKITILLPESLSQAEFDGCFPQHYADQNGETRKEYDEELNRFKLVWKFRDAKVDEYSYNITIPD